MDGPIIVWNYLLNTTIGIAKPKDLYKTKAAVTSLKFACTAPLHLLATYTSGEISIFKEMEEGFIQLYTTMGHEAGISTESFGTLGRYAEIWSSAWDYNGMERLATVSEDQTCRVWELATEPFSVLEVFKVKEHKLAVTCVDWKNTKLGKILVTCSDDRTIKLYNADKNFEKIAEFSTTHLTDWHTLTYLELEENGTRLACGTQHGYLGIWDLITKENVFLKKVQNGGIEGLRWRGNIIATCSSDCAILLTKIT
jgi:WD40 repeat protein